MVMRDRETQQDGGKRLPRTSDVTISRVHAIRCVVHFELAASLLHSTRMNRVIKYQRIASRHRALLEASVGKELNYLPAKGTYLFTASTSDAAISRFNQRRFFKHSMRSSTVSLRTL